jgi:hypothetical protein
MASTEENELEKQKQNEKLVALGKEAVANKEALAKEHRQHKHKY